MTAPGPAVTPGQAAYEAYVTSIGLLLSDWPWEAHDVNQAMWNAVAQAAIAAQQPQPAPELAGVVAKVIGTHMILRESPHEIATAVLAAIDARPPQPAPGDLETARAALAKIATTLLEGPEDERTALVATARGALLEMKGADPAPQPAPDDPGADADQVAVLRQLVDDVGVLAANAPEDGDLWGVLEQITMMIASHGVPDEPGGS